MVDANDKVQVIAVWGNGDAESEILVSKRHWARVLRGGKLSRWARGRYEGGSFAVHWEIQGREVSVQGGDSGDCFLGGVEDLIVCGWGEQ